MYSVQLSIALSGTLVANGRGLRGGDKERREDNTCTVYSEEVRHASRDLFFNCIPMFFTSVDVVYNNFVIL